MNNRRDITVFPDGVTPEPGVYVTVKDSSDNLVSLFDDDGNPLGNPIVSGTNGAFSYNVVADGTYIEEFRLSPTALPRKIQAVTLGVSSLIHITPELYGAVGYPLGSNDGPAIHAAGVAISALGFGAFEAFPGRKYIVGGGQVLSPGHQGSGYSFPPQFDFILDIVGCTGPVLINMNGATFKCADGAKYGTFNDDGTNKGTVAPSFTGGLATPYKGMIRVKSCTGIVEVTPGELDGNIANLVIGGDYGDLDIQIDCDGLLLEDNTGGVIVDGLVSHHHGRDGGVGNGPGAINVTEQVEIRNCRFLNNVRQGFSLVGGNGWHFSNTKFNDTGRNIGSMNYTAPGNGLDMEASGGRWVRNVTFDDCEWVNNISIGCNAPADTSAFSGWFTFNNCRFIGTTNVSCWVNAQHTTYNYTLFVGTMIGMYSSASNPAAATKFNHCTFAYDHTLSPTGTVYVSTLPGAAASAFMDFTFGDDGLEFNRCDFIHAEATGLVNIGTYLVRFRDCNFNNASTGGISIAGMFEGQNTRFHNISAHPDPVIATARFVNWAGMAFDSYRWEETRSGTGGPYALARYEATGDKETGKRIYRASATWNPASVASAAQTTTTIPVTGVVLGDVVEDVGFSLSLQGLNMRGYVSAADTVTIALSNATGGAVDLGSGTVRVKVRQV